MKKLALLLAALVACAPARDDASEAFTEDAVSNQPPVAQADTAPGDTMLKGNTSPDAPVSAPAVETQRRVRGTVRVTGTAIEPVTIIQTTAGSLVVRGPLEPELRALDGAVVMVNGKETAAGTRTIAVEDYAVAEVDGQPVTVGIVTADARAVLVGGDTVTLVPPPAGLEPATKVWVAGTRTGNQLRVSSYGVIRAPK